MENARTLLFYPIRFGVHSICIATLGSCLMAAASFADVSPQKQRSIETSPAFEVLRDGSRSATTPLVDWLGPLEGTGSCFWAETRNGAQPSLEGKNRPDSFSFACVRVGTNPDEPGWAGHEAKGDHTKSVGNWSEAEQAYANAVGLLERTADREVNQDLAALFNKLGTTRFKRKDFAGAEQAFRRALTIYTATRGAEDLHVADSLDLLANALFEQPQERVLAGPLFYRAGAIRESILAQDHPAVADSLHHIAVSLYSDNLAIAIPLFLRSKQIREQVFGHDHPLVADSLHTMARLYETHDRRDLAIPLYQEALTIQERVFGPTASETVQVRDYLNMAHRLTEGPGADPKPKK